MYLYQQDGALLSSCHTTVSVSGRSEWWWCPNDSARYPGAYLLIVPTTIPASSHTTSTLQLYTRLLISARQETHQVHFPHKGPPSDIAFDCCFAQIDF